MWLNFKLIFSQIYLRRQQERGLMQKTRRLMDENSVSFQMFLILLSFITFGSESQISVFKQCQSKQHLDVCFFVIFFGGGGGGGACAQAKIWSFVFSVKKSFIRHFVRLNFLASFISLYFEILSYLS